jgi:hypothetical protein
MRVSRVAAGLAATVTAVLGLSLATAGPAAAAGAWHAYGNTNPVTSTSDTYFWGCGATGTVTSDVIAQLCVQRQIGTSRYRSAVIVRNNRSSLYSASTTAVLDAIDGTTMNISSCPQSGVAANSWSVCYGTTVGPASGGSAYADSGNVNGHGLDPSEAV